MVVVVKEYGASIGKKGNCILIKGKNSREISVYQIEELHIYPACSISSDALELCSENDIWVIFADKYGNPMGEFLPFSGGCSPIYKRKQLQLAYSPFGIELVKEFLIRKIENRISHLKHILHNKRKQDVIEYIKLAIRKMEEETEKIKEVHGKNIAEVRHILLGYEGSAGRAYFDAISKVLPSELGFVRRERNATDVYNCALNYLYGILYSKIKNLMYKCRLDPYIGIMHVDTYNKPTFVYDCIEGQRILCEEAVYQMCSKGQLRQMDFSTDSEKGIFTEEAKTKLVREFYRVMNEKCSYRKQAITRERRMLFELQEVAKRIERMEDVLGAI